MLLYLSSVAIDHGTCPSLDKMHLSAALASLCLLCLHHAGASVVKRAVTPTVSIASGVVVGTSTTVAGSPTASIAAYLGIPYAAPPQRFSPASPPAPWTKPLVAQQLSPICMQQFVVLAPGRSCHVGGWIA